MFISRLCLFKEYYPDLATFTAYFLQKENNLANQTARDILQTESASRH